jgi:hypothetical protein
MFLCGADQLLLCGTDQLLLFKADQLLLCVADQMYNQAFFGQWRDNSIFGSFIFYLLF